MFLAKASIRHFKSLDTVDIAFSRPITVLVGPNAVGKSNVVDVFRFVRDAIVQDLEHAVTRRGGMGRVRQWSKSRPYKLGIQLTFEQRTRDDPLEAAYEFAIAPKTNGGYAVDLEQMACHREATRNSDAPVLDTFIRRGADVQTSRDDVLDLASEPPDDQLLLHAGPITLAIGGAPLVRFLGASRFASLYPNLMREPGVPDNDVPLAEDGRNWASVIKTLRRTVRGRAALDRIHEAMRAVLPGFQDVTVTTVGHYLVPRFRFAVAGAEVHEFDATQLSDGTLRIFGLLLAMYQDPAPSMLFIEEPEQTVHPGVLGVLAEAMREASENTQIVVTTHSPQFVDHFQPEEIRVVSLDDEGLTHVSGIKASQVDSVKERLMSLQDFMLAEGLLPETR